MLRRLKLARCAAAGLIATAAALTLSSGARSLPDHGHPTPTHPMFAFSLATPSAGDVSYAVAQVRIVHGLRSPATRRGHLALAARVGGLSIDVRSDRWRALRSSTRVYFVASRVAGAGADVRDVAFFVLRHRTGTWSDRVAGGDITFTIADARPVLGAFWVRGVDRRGDADVFRVHDILATAVANWGRYLRVLKAAHALTAAMRAIVNSPAGPVVRRRAGPRLWTGGQRPDRRVRGMFRLITSTLGDPTAFAAAKTSTLVPAFISNELHNPSLARRWRAVTAKLPLHVPDRYAAAALEEERFTSVRAPKISKVRVALDDPPNSSSLAGSQTGRSFAPDLHVDVVPSGLGTVITHPDGMGIDCPQSLCDGWFAGTVTLVAAPAPGAVFDGWDIGVIDPVIGDVAPAPCDSTNPVPAPAGGSSCAIDMSGSRLTPNPNFGTAVVVQATFKLTKRTLTVTKTGSQSGMVTSNPAGIDCGSTCSSTFDYGTSVTLTATPSPGSTFAGWSGCLSVSGPTCVTTPLLADATVAATFGSPVVISRVAGTGARCASPPNCGDNGQAKDARITVPAGVATDSSGNLYFADTGDNEVRKIAPEGTVTRVAGTGAPCTTAPNCGDGGPAADAELDGPTGVALDAAGDVYVADTFDAEVRKIAPDGTITRVAGNGTLCTTSPNCADGGPATDARLNAPNGVAVDARGDLYIGDSGDNEIRAVAPTAIISTVAGNGTACTTYPRCGDGAPATAAQLDGPSGVALGPDGELYIADTFDNEIRRIESDGTISRFAGTGMRCTSAPDCGDGASPSLARLNAPTALAFDANGSLYVADSGDDEVRRIEPDGPIFAFAGSGKACMTAPNCGDDGPAAAAQLATPLGVAADAAGNVYIADSVDNEVRRAAALGMLQPQLP